MEASYPRRTVRRSASFEGRGLHSGDPVEVIVHPGQDGIWFRQGTDRVAARPESVSDTTRCTRLGSVATVEHLMSALAGLGITDAEIEVSGGEMPALDGSAAAFVAGLLEVELDEIGELVVTGPFARVFHHDGNSEVAIARGNGHWRFDYVTGDRWPHTQSFDAHLSPGLYAAEIAPARTFALAEEVPAIQAAGLARGLDLESALILGSDSYQNRARFDDEPARHKLLDLVGDLALAGVPVAHLGVVCVRGGHRVNVAAAAKLAEHVTVVRR